MSHEPAQIARRAVLKGITAGLVLGGSVGEALLRHRASFAAEGPELVGQWTAPARGPFRLTAIHAVLLHTGAVLLVKNNQACVWDPGSGAAVRRDAPEDVLCRGHVVL